MADSFVQPHMKKALEDHVLTQVKTEGPVQMFYLHKKDSCVSAGILVGREMSTLFLFTPEGIIITGDLCPRACRRGCISSLGYSLGWFTSSELGEDYLCEKFLERGCYAENVRQWLEYVSKSDEDMEKRSIAANLLDSAPADDDEASNFLFDALQQLGEDYDNQAQGYEPSDAGWLCALQQRFRALYHSGQVRASP